jgi:hypothetical protein
MQHEERERKERAREERVCEERAREERECEERAREEGAYPVERWCGHASGWETESEALGRCCK